jgi:hypothetical protein
MELARVSTPLRPAGLLPLKGGDCLILLPRLVETIDRWRGRFCNPISPLEGEMPGRAEGGSSKGSAPRW